MQIITQSEYDSAPSSNKSVWTTERTDLKYWDATRHLYMGKRTLPYKGGLLIEGIGFVIVPNASEHVKRPQFDRCKDYGNSVVSSHTKRLLAGSFELR